MEIKESGSEKARAAGEQVREESSRIAHEAAESGKSVLDEQKGVFAEQFGGVANALHRSAEELRKQHQETTARYIDWAAGGLEKMSRTLRDKDVDSILSQSQEFARRQPVVFFAGAVAAGFMLSRFLKASPKRETEPRGGYAEGAGAKEAYTRESVAMQPSEASVMPGTGGLSGTPTSTQPETGAPRAGGPHGDK